MGDASELEVALEAGYQHGQADAHIELERLRSELKQARDIIGDCQQRLASYLPPDSGISPQQCISDLLEILDGPRARSFLKEHEDG